MHKKNLVYNRYVLAQVFRNRVLGIDFSKKNWSLVLILGVAEEPEKENGGHQ